MNLSTPLETNSTLFDENPYKYFTVTIHSFSSYLDCFHQCSSRDRLNTPEKVNKSTIGILHLIAPFDDVSRRMIQLWYRALF
jgi:hypothetical protein